MGGPAVLVGNSLGGYNALATAAASPALVSGLVLLNAAGRFEEPGEAEAAAAKAAAEADSVWAKVVSQGEPGGGWRAACGAGCSCPPARRLLPSESASRV